MIAPPEKPEEIPSLWQKKVIWSALAFISIFAIGGLSVYLIKLTTEVLSYLQPILVPIAIAGVLAFLLEPVVNMLCGWGVKRLRAVLLVFFIVFTCMASILIWIIPEAYTQGTALAQKLPGYTLTARKQVDAFFQKHAQRFGLPDHLFNSPDQTVTEESTGPAEESVRAEAAKSDSLAPYVAQLTTYLQEQAPTLLQKFGGFLQRSVGGFLGVFGFLLGLVIVPIYLFFFLIEGPKISNTWSEYVPLRASHFKDEVVETLTEINGYLINFFRGQLLVSLIDGAFTALALLIVGLDYALLIGLMVGILGLIPYIGILLCWVPAVLIAAVQWQGEWFHPLLITGIFVLVQQLDGLFIAPKIVGNSVGLHPMTVIVSLFAWTLVLGGLLGAILAVPLTATLKVLLKRYVWEKQIRQTTSIPIKPDNPVPDSDGKALQ